MVTAVEKDNTSTTTRTPSSSRRDRAPSRPHSKRTPLRVSSRTTVQCRVDYNLGMLGLPEGVHACLFDLDGVLTQTAKVHAAAWKDLFDDYLHHRAERLSEPF